jgi:hypothetical protein
VLVINLLGGRLCLLIGPKGGSKVLPESRDFTKVIERKRNAVFVSNFPITWNCV